MYSIIFLRYCNLHTCINFLILRNFSYDEFMRKSRGYEVKSTLRIIVLLQFINRSQIGILNVIVVLYYHVV